MKKTKYKAVQKEVNATLYDMLSDICDEFKLPRIAINRLYDAVEVLIMEFEKAEEHVK